MVTEVDYATLSLVSQILRRQGDVHAAKMKSYVRAECSLSSADLGVILRVFHPLNMVAVDLGDRAFGLAGDLGRGAAGAVDATVQSYRDSDGRTGHALAAIASQLAVVGSHSTIPNSSSSKLGPAASVADADYRAGEGSAFEQAGGLPGEAFDVARDLVDGSIARGRALASGSAGVIERNDASSYLVPSVSKTSEMDELRWSAGPLLGGIDWVFEQLFGFSLLEDVIMKPLAGNWEEIDKASIGWSHLGRSLMAMGGNYTGLPDMTLSWTGAAAEAFRAAMAAMGAAIAGLSYAADYVSGLVGNIATVARLAAAGIGSALRIISIKLVRMAVEACVPGVGWAAAVVEGGILITNIFASLKHIYTLINLIVDAISDFISAKAKLVQTALIVEDLLEYVARGGVRAVTS